MFDNRGALCACRFPELRSLSPGAPSPRVCAPPPPAPASPIFPSPSPAWAGSSCGLHRPFLPSAHLWSGTRAGWGAAHEKSAANGLESAPPGLLLLVSCLRCAAKLSETFEPGWGVVPSRARAARGGPAGCRSPPAVPGHKCCPSYLLSLLHLCALLLLGGERRPPVTDSSDLPPPSLPFHRTLGHPPVASAFGPFYWPGHFHQRHMRKGAGVARIFGVRLSWVADLKLLDNLRSWTLPFLIITNQQFEFYKRDATRIFTSNNAICRVCNCPTESDQGASRRNPRA
uniref:Uncharacterized protein LOC110218922 n=1 Tax=Phascolarctos cinereus TaxID=38626 RepID=A0A6P5LHI7_PHACI|nr:uncharacterized protein LOC110218922 [Phascolarctos cinereus]